jgi:hypothetical protein
VKIQEIEEKLAEIRTEYGNNDGVIPDVFEPTWINSITDIQFDPDREVTVFTTD